MGQSPIPLLYPSLSVPSPMVAIYSRLGLPIVGPSAVQDRTEGEIRNLEIGRSGWAAAARTTGARSSDNGAHDCGKVI